MSPRRVLVIDDNRSTADLLALVLDRWGHEVQVAYDGPDGLEVASSFRPQVVILDIDLPTLDGVEVASRLRCDTAHDEIVLMALTGHDFGDLPGAQAPRLFDYRMRKPLSFDALERQLALAIGAEVSTNVGPSA